MRSAMMVYLLFLSFRAPAQSVTSFEPSAPVLPSNTLRFYVTFDHAARGLIHQRDIKLLDLENKAVQNAFMDFGQELWSPDGKRLTVLFDPGKVKRGVEGVSSELSPLKNGQTYKIKIGSYLHRFRVGSAIREKINPSTWKISAVEVPVRALDIKFDRVMDTALLQDQLEVLDENGRSVDGTLRATSGGSGALFTSSLPMKRGQYQIKISPIFEDVAGNRISDALDHSINEKPDEASELIIKTVLR